MPGYFGFRMSFLYTINLPVSLLSTALSISSRKCICSNRLGASCRGAVLRYTIIASWVLDFIGDFLLHVLCMDGSSVSFFIMRWDASRGDRRGVVGCSTLGGGTTLGGVAFWGSWGVGMMLER